MPVRRTILILISVLATAIMAVAVVGALPLVVPTDFAVRQLQQAVKAATGRTLTVSGAPRIVLWPELSIEADDAVLSNPPGLYHGQLAAIPRLRLKIDARALLERRLEVKQLTLVNPRITLVSDDAGRANWALAGAEFGQPGRRRRLSAAARQPCHGPDPNRERRGALRR